jgi:hypothetical protein
MRREDGNQSRSGDENASESAQKSSGAEKLLAGIGAAIHFNLSTQS